MRSPMPRRMFRELPSLFDFPFWEARFPSVDISEKDNEYEIKADVPGFDKDQIEIELRDNLLSISGRVEESQNVEESGYIRRERRSGAFTRTLELPSDAVVDQAEASFANGVLTIRVPKSGEKRGRRLEIK